MVEADEDVPDPFAAVVQELIEPGGIGQFKFLPRPLGTQDRGDAFPTVLDAHQSAVRRVEVGEQAVFDFDFPRGPESAALDRKPQNLVSAVAVVIHLMPDCRKGAPAAVGRQREPGQRVG